MPRLFLLLIIAVFAATAAHADVPVRDLPSGAVSPPAKITDVAFLEGFWVGQGLGGQTEEAYSSPLGGAMVGYFRFVKENKVVFYEIVTIVETSGSLAIRLKHFHADLKGWEEKDDVQEFNLVAIEGQTVYFDGLSLRRDGDTLYSAVKIKNRADGSTRVEQFSYRLKK
jgi:hypothetical protein